MRQVVRLRFQGEVNMQEVDLTVELAVLGASILHGSPAVRLGFGYALSHDKRTVVLRWETDAGLTAARLMIGFSEQEYGREMFTIEWVDERSGGAASPPADPGAPK